MSLPTKQLQKLQIRGRMPTTRSQAQRKQHEGQGQTRTVGTFRSTEQDIARREIGPSAGEGSGSSFPTWSSPGEKIITGLTGNTYDCGQLSPVSRSRALEGLNADIDVAQCREINGYYAFEIPERASVRIGPPEGPYPDPTCSCSDFQNRKSACKHIYWLLDHLRLAQPFAVTAPPVLTSVGSAEQYSSAFESVASLGLDELTKRLGWPPQQHDPPPFDIRRNQVQDMLSVFDSEGVLPEYYKTDMFADITDVPLSGQECYVPGELDRTVINLAMNDDAVFRALREAISPGRCALAYVGKLRSRAQSAISRLDAYVTDGSSEQDQASTDVPWCASTLRSLVSQTSQCLNSRAPLPAEVLTKAAGFLVELLQHISTRNEDVYEDIDWERNTPENENEADRNLYVHLIGNPPPLSDQSTHKQANFVIDDLRDFPPASVQQYTERLEEISQMVMENGASEDYTQALGELIERLEGAAVSSVSGQKRRRVR